MDRDQLVQDLLNERSFSTEKDATGNYVDLRNGADSNGLPTTPVGDMRSYGARLAGHTEADARAEAGRMADQILDECA